MIDQRLGPYRITEEIGSGGMATVYRAYQPSMDRHVAIKVIRSSILHEPTLKERFRREARLIAKLEHPHLLPVYDFDGDHDPPYIVMRYLEGGTLKQVMEHGSLPHEEMLYMLGQVSAALDYAHRQGVVHRDLKPSNVMIDREGNAFVTDFGIARSANTSGQENLTDPSNLIGTPAYMSPEQARGQSELDGSADLYALGVMVFELLTGSLPFQHESSLGVLMAHLNEPVPSATERNDKLPQAVNRVLGMALAKEKSGRYPKAEAFVTDLTKALKVRSTSSPTRLQALTQTISIDQLKAYEEKTKKAKKETPSSATPTEIQRQMTALYVDVTDLASALYEAGNDAETVRIRMDALWSRFDEIAREQGGVIQSRAENLGLALWGRARISEDDAERAIRAALLMREATLSEAKKFYGAEWEPTEETPLPFVAAVTSGPVLLERSDQSGTYTASGATIILATRMKEGAPPGGILIEHDTFTQVRGVFTIHSYGPLRIRGRKDPIEVYTVMHVKARAFRLKSRGIEGVETRMIGRENELRVLQEAFTLTIEDGETQVVTVVGEAGVGKSRLLFEFKAWSELHEELFWIFEARATQPSMLQPYSLTRDLFSFRFQILDSDPLDVVHQKVVEGVAGFLGPGSENKAELMGQLVGFNFSEYPVVADALKDSDAFRRRALEYLGEFFYAACQKSPVMIHIEDLHWADDRSLDLINNLVRENVKLPLFMLCMARPSLYERRPQWGEGQRFHERVELEPLSQLSSRRLVRELLKKVPEVPPELRDLVVERADGNPFYIEELIKALIDDGVIVKGEEQWSVDRSRLSSVRIPPTLTGVLQSRLDALPLPLQQLLQRVSVIGRIFWDAAAVHLSRDSGLEDDEIRNMLEDLRQREMILRREESSIAGTVEYVFRHAILRDVTYETLVPRQRRSLHRVAGDWFLEMGGDRAGELTLLVAEHYERAGEPALAAEQLQRAGEAALQVSAVEEALTTLRKARELVLAPEHLAVRLRIDVAIGEAHSLRSEYDEARRVLESMLPDARRSENKLLLAKTLGHLGRIALWQEDKPAAHRYLDEALPLTRAAGDQRALIFILRQMGNLVVLDAEKALPLIEESLEIARRVGDSIGESSALNSLGNVHETKGDWSGANKYFKESLQIGRENGYRFMEATATSNLALTEIALGDFGQAQRTMTAGHKLAREVGDRRLELGLNEQDAWLAIRTGRDDEARSILKANLSLNLELGVRPLSTLCLLAVLEGRSGNHVRALEWVGMLRSGDLEHSSASKIWLSFHMADVWGDLSQAEIDAALARGATMSVDEVLRHFEKPAKETETSQA
jgi:serine/threonine protein kinase/tetratricopeptide (TPR) repeat protein